ncbi:putative complex I LYR family protein [Lyophyllum shimeji]|uniref:Complex I LYR family protein n=1 Tax=Lyophyllum shimeji TaxID=47721 RepID=A0A9P3PS32_LYOSH|nr:putative complex I LYR family protein [Lyophyllum shimeji]
MQHGHQPSRESLAFRANLARLLSPLRRVRPRVPFYDIAAHRIPTLWSLYRGLLRQAPTDDIKWRVRMLFRQNQHLTGTAATRKNLEKGYKVGRRCILRAVLFNEDSLKFLAAFQRANAGDEKQRAILQRYSQALATKSDKEYWKHLARNEMAWQIKLANRPIMTGGFLRPTPANRPLPRLKPQPWAITSMIRKRRAARERQMLKLAELQESLNDIWHEAKFEAGVARLAGKADSFTPVFASHVQDWSQPLETLRRDIRETFPRAQQRRDEPYPPEMLDAIMAARREKIANKTRERERERRGEILRRTILRQNKGPPAHVLSMMTPEQRKMDKIARSVSEVGYVARVKRKLGFKLRKPDAWKAEIGHPEDKERLNRLSGAIREESARRVREESPREQEARLGHGRC